MTRCFASPRGGHLTERAVNYMLKRAAANAGINPKLSAHWLRHAHASHAIRFDGANGREGILDTMMELRDQCALAFLRTLAVGHVDVDACHPLRTPILSLT